LERVESESEKLRLAKILEGKRVRVLYVRIGILLLIASMLILSITPLPVWAQQNGTSDAISAAQNKLVNCFDAAKSAEAAGANISQLTSTLNKAGLLLSNAQLAYSNGNYGDAQNFASQSQSLLTNFVSEANSLQAVATQHRNTDFLFFVGSIVGSVIVIVAGIAIWVLLMKKYGKSEVAKT
jgi:hypothetical protein